MSAPPSTEATITLAEPPLYLGGTFALTDTEGRTWRFGLAASAAERYLEKLQHGAVVNVRQWEREGREDLTILDVVDGGDRDWTVGELLGLGDDVVGDSSRG